MLQRSALAAVIFAGFASSALAETAPTPSPAPVQQPENFGAKSSSQLGIYSSTTQMTLLRLSMTYGDQPGVTPDQWRRARRAASLIKTNRCQDAYNQALDEQDYRLAGNIAAACKAHFRD